MPESTPHAGPAERARTRVVRGRHLEAVHGAGLRLPVLGRVLGVEPGLDRIAPRGRRWLGVEAAAVGDGQLQLDEVETGGELGDRVLDLQPGVHLEEEEVTGRVVLSRRP